MAKELIQPTEHIYQLMVESVPVAIIFVSTEGKITFANHAAEMLFGYSSKEIIGGDTAIFLPPGHGNEEKELIAKIMQVPGVSHYETERMQKGGAIIDVAVTISPIKDSLGKVIGASKISLDITERKKREKEKDKRAEELIVANRELVFQNSEKEKRAAELIIANQELAFQSAEKGKRASELVIANNELILQNADKEKRAMELTKANAELVVAEEQLKAANDELEAFSYSVSHDLRAPLRAIHGYTQILKEDYGEQLNEDANRVMNNIMKSAQKMGMLVDDLLAFSRLGRKELQEQDINMDNMVQEICSELQNEQPQRVIEFHTKPLQSAQADNTTIRQVWYNLIANAINYTGHRAQAIIEIGSEIKGTEIIYYVKDNGAGFDMRYANKLFGVFQRLHSEDEFEGTGVGLAIVQRIILKHKGRVWAEGKVDEGATFYFTLNK